MFGVASFDVSHRREHLMAAARQPFGRVTPESRACPGDEYHSAHVPSLELGAM
jgi:hypothetical protein